MIYLKCVLVGAVAALVASVIYILAVFVFPLMFQLSRVSGTGAAGVGISFNAAPVLGMALIAFAGGFYWQLRRGSKPRPRAR